MNNKQTKESNIIVQPGFNWATLAYCLFLGETAPGLTFYLNGQLVRQKDQQGQRLPPKIKGGTPFTIAVIGIELSDPEKRQDQIYDVKGTTYNVDAFQDIVTTNHERLTVIIRRLNLATWQAEKVEILS